VGYGKTEVALRAAFKVVMDGKQVAILVPTTLLAEQHFETFTDRMKSFPVTIRMLSRFQTPAEQKEIVKQVGEGACDIVIGTHRLLSKDVSFKDLGLVVIDEEQRFGVRHKEHLKRLRLLVDVLTLTATPIPRTLYMSLVGAKDMSTINTPPRNRKPIETVVTAAEDAVIAQAIRAELARKGQVFFIHNRVEGIEHVAKKVQTLVPEARVAVGHGQMPSRALESVMKKFTHGEVDVLVSTTIVESGIDIPNANTLIVNRADHFGLSELYQLRGRVGRFDRTAHAYLLVPKGTLLTEESRKRLAAIERFTHLGAGFNVAMEDLEIRGAGNILGTEQSGYISGVGFDLYCRILQETVRHLRSEKSALPAPA
jgi:transcription-repair coupling factor (superfamily II helicase)